MALYTYLILIGTQEISVFPFKYNDYITVHLVDTPGFDDTDRTDSNVLQEIASFPRVSFQAGLKLNDNRLQGSSMRSMSMFRNIINGSIYENIVLATTIWESLDLEDGIKRETSLIEHSDDRGMSKQEGCQIRRHKNTKTSGMELINFFVKERTDKVILDLQEDLVTKKKDLVDTAAGKEARDQFAEGIQQARRDLEITKAELREALRAQDKQWVLQLHREKIDASNNIEKLQKHYETFSEDMHREFEKANKRQEAKLRAMIQENKTLREGKDGIDKNFMS